MFDSQTKFITILDDFWEQSQNKISDVKNKQFKYEYFK